MPTLLSPFATAASAAVRVGVTASAAVVGATQALVGPAAHVTRGAVGGVLGLTGQSPPVAWSADGRLHLDLEPLVPFPVVADSAGRIERAVRAVPGVSAAHVEQTLGRLVVEHQPDLVVDDVCDAVRAAASQADAQVQTSPAASRATPVADPGDRLALVVPAVTAILDMAAVAVSVAGGLGHIPAAPRAARAAAAVINHQPRVVAALEWRLGRLGTDVLLNSVTAAAHGFGQAPGTPTLDLVQRVAQISEARAHRQCWARREPALANHERPQAPLVPVTSSTLADLSEPRHSLAAAAAGEVSHVVVDAAVDVAVDDAKDAATGLVEDYTEQAANASLVAAAGALFASGNLNDVADSILAGVPKAAHLGRGMFAAVLGRGLAREGQLVLDPGALRRLDRVEVVVIDGAALRGDARAVVGAQGCIQGWDADRVYQVADALLHEEAPPDPDTDELPAPGAQLRWHTTPAAASMPAEGLEHADLEVGGQTVGVVAIGWELDPYAAPLIEATRRSGARVELRHVAGTEDLAAAVAATHPPGTPLLKVVRELRNDRGPVLLVTALHPDFASVDTLAALTIADVGIALDDPNAATPWTADILTGTDLLDVVRIVSALPAARRASASAVRFAKAGSTLAGLLLVTGETGSRRRVGLGRWLSPVNAAGAMALVSGTLDAMRALRLPDPDPQLLTAWHALDAGVVYSRLSEQAELVADSPASSVWRRRLTALSDSALAAPLRRPAQDAVRLVAATRRELSDPLTPVLAVGAAASAILGSSVDALLVGGVMVVNAFVGGGQRVRADNAAAELFAEQDQHAHRVAAPVVGSSHRRLTVALGSPRTVTVPAAGLHPGDIVDLRANEVVPADARLLVAEDLEVDESSLTGESVPVDKQAESVPVGEAVNRAASMVFEGSTVVAGRGRAIVVATGTATAAHRAIWAASDVESAPGIQARLRDLTSKVLPLTLAGGGVVAGLSLLRGRTPRQAIADGVAVSVAAVPEGLPLVATIAQLAAARRLSRLGVLVRSHRTLEALGRIDTVCFDKTGTLTENRLKVVAVATTGDRFADLPTTTDPTPWRILQAAARACPRPKTEEGHVHATDEAILTAASGAPADLVTDWSATGAQVPFESSRGYSAAVGTQTDANSTDTETLLVVKGAPEVIHPRCRFAGDDERADADRAVLDLAERGLRVIAVAQRPVDSEITSDPDDTDVDAVDAAVGDLELLGYLGLADTPRASARPLLDELTASGRTVVLITGDHPVTARAIAGQLGLPADVRVVTGDDLTALDEEARAELASSAQVFARVSPDQKRQVVTALQRSGRITGMVGDGANDAAAIRVADVGIGVSGRGSTAARGAADLVLTGDDLTTLLDALVEGKDMWLSVRDALVILLGGNAGEVTFTIIGTALGGRAPLTTRQLLLVNLLTDMFPALAVAVTPPRPPAPDATGEASEGELEAARLAQRHEALSEPAPSLGRPLVRELVSRGATTAAGATVAWAIGHWTPGTYRRSATMGLTALVGTQLAQTLLTRVHSPLVVATAVGSTAVLVAVVQIPGVSQFFGCTPLGPAAWAGVIAGTAGAGALSLLAPRWLERHVRASVTGSDPSTDERTPTDNLSPDRESDPIELR